MANFSPPPKPVFMEHKTIAQLATEYAMLCSEDRAESSDWFADETEIKQHTIRMHMTKRVGAVAADAAIKQAYETLKIVDFHKEN